MTKIQAEIEDTLAATEPQVEVLLAEVLGGQKVRLFIDHPDGVTLDVCERVANALAEVRERYALEVSSPGPERPLSKPEHYRRFLGRKARIRTRGECVVEPTGNRSITGELVGASETEVTIAGDGVLVTIPFTNISRSNLVES